MLTRNGFLYEVKKNKVLFLMLLPAVVYFIVFHYLPMVGILLAFKNFNYSDGIWFSPWAGLDNFKFLFKSGDLLLITKNTILYNLGFILVNDTLAICTAILLSELSGRIYKKYCQSVMLLPYFISFVLLGAFSYNLFNYEFGSLNTLLKFFNLQPINVYGMPEVWKYILVAFNTWKWVGYGTIIYLAAIMNISSEYYEAAKIDGATIAQQIRFITFPLLMPTIMIVFLFKLGSIVRGQFELFYQIVGDNGTLYKATDIIDTYVFRSLARNFDIGMGTAAGLYQSLFGFVLIMLVNYVIKKVREDYALF